jgi:hypothetical protein
MCIRSRAHAGVHPIPCSEVERLDATVKRYVPGAVVAQGEAGAPAEWMRGGAMEPYNWTETLQLKWDLRAMVRASFLYIFTCVYWEGKVLL